MKNIILLLAVLSGVTGNAQVSQKEFVIGAYTPPALVHESATPAVGDFNGDTKADLGARINSGPNKGKFQIDYFNVTNPWFQKNGWAFKTTSSIYGAANDVVVIGDYDGDKKADIGIYFPATKTWSIDYAANNFGVFDVSYSYASNPDIDQLSIPVPARYDIDNKTDIAFKTGTGKWLIDYSQNGLGKIDEIETKYESNNDHPVPADYDGDGVADLSVKTDEGEWKIDYFSNGYKGWDVIVTGCGNQHEIPVPADYNGDGKTDLSVKTDDGAWKVAYTYLNGSLISWLQRSTGKFYGGNEAIPIPADFNGDGKADFSFAFTNDGRWLIDDFAAVTNGYDWVSDAGKTADDFNWKNLNPLDIKNYLKVKNCYFNLLVDGMAKLKYNSQKDYFLSLMDSVHLFTMLTDPYIYSFGDPDNTEAFDKRQFITRYNSQLPEKFKQHIYAINLGDEPSDKESAEANTNVTSMERAKRWTKYFNEQYPQKAVFNNLLPRVYSKFTSDADYLNYLDTYKKSSNSPFVCFDHYPFGTNGFDPLYFPNLSMIKHQFSDRAFWATVWSAFSKVNDYQNPDDKQLQFMAFCPVAYGAKGIVYFPYGSYFNSNFSLALNDDEKKYYAVKNINLFLKNIAGPVALAFQNIATLHKSNTDLNKGYNFSNSELLANYTKPIVDVNDNNILVGVFIPGKAPAKDISKKVNFFLWLVNKDLNDIKDLKITLKGNFVNKIQISPRVFKYAENPTTKYRRPASVGYNRQQNTTTFTIPLLGGAEAIMVKLL